MENRRLFLRAFARMLLVCLLLWAAAMGALLYVNWRWSQEDIARRQWEVPNQIIRGQTKLDARPGPESGLLRVVSLEEQPSAALTMSSVYGLWRYGGQTVLRYYDASGRRLGQSQLLVGLTSLTDEDGQETVCYLLFDPVLTEEQQVEAARILNCCPQLTGAERWDEIPEDERLNRIRVTGWAEGEVLYPQKISLLLGEEWVVLMKAEAAQWEGRELSDYSSDWVEFYSALAGRGGPEVRLERFRAMEAELDELEERWAEHQADPVDMLSNGYYKGAHNATLQYTGGVGAVASAYTLPPYYVLCGLEPALLLTLAAAVALAGLLAGLETRAIRRERAFTRAAAHELKTPLAVLRTHAEALREDIAPDKRGEYLGVVLDESDRMAALVGSLLELSRLEQTGDALLLREPVELSALVRDAFARLALPLEQKGLRLELALTEGVMYGDRARLAELVGNLASNALRYAQPGGMVRAAVEQRRGGWFLSVDNDGATLSQEELGHLFEPFYRGDGARSRETGGTGLGLAIVRAVAKAHGGSCWVENRTGGVCVWVRLPALQSGR